MFKHYIDKYEISEKGELRNSISGRLLKPKINKKGYVYYTVSCDGVLRDISAHRAVAISFLENPDDLEQINHIDGNKTNNHYSNLEWMTQSQNMKHAFENNLLNFSSIEVPVIQLTKDDDFIAEFKSASDAAREVNGYRSHITSCCKGTRKTHKGYKWKYKICL